MSSRGAIAVPVLVLALAVTGCSTSAPSDESTPRSLSFTDINDWTGSDYYTVGSPIEGVSDTFGDRLMVPLLITHYNQTIINPEATVTFDDGTTFTCQEEDLRRLPSLVESTTDTELPCDGLFPEDATGGHIIVTDEYK